MDVLLIPAVNTIYSIPVNSIRRIEAISNYSRIYFADGSRLVVAKVLCWFQQKLPAEIFVRVNRGDLVNKLFVKELRGEHTKTVLMYNGESIVISRRRKNEIVAVMAA